MSDTRSIVLAAKHLGIKEIGPFSTDHPTLCVIYLNANPRKRAWLKRFVYTCIYGADPMHAFNHLTAEGVDRYV